MMIVRVYPVMTQVCFEVCHVPGSGDGVSEPRGAFLVARSYFPEESVATPFRLADRLAGVLADAAAYAGESPLDWYED